MLQFPSFRNSLKREKPKTLNFPLLNKTLYLQNKQNITSKQKSSKTQKSVLYLDTYHFDSGDNCIKRILNGQGWKQLPSSLVNSEVRLKWISLPKVQHFHNLQPNQKINHFKDSFKLTTKLGLFKMLSSPQQFILSQQGNNYIHYYPRSYDLSTGFAQFQADFKHTSVLNLIKKLMIHVQLQHQQTLYKKYRKICEKQSVLTQQIIQQRIEYFIKTQSTFQSLQKLNGSTQQKIMINKEVFLCLLKYVWNFLQGRIYNKLQVLIGYSTLTPPFKSFEVHFMNRQQNIGFLSHQAGIFFFQLYQYCLKTFKYFLNDGLNNIWVVKANQSSRGRSVNMIDKLDQVYSYINGGNRLIQKYIQNVWILNYLTNQYNQQHPNIHKILHRKFDIRFWVLVKSFCPLQAYIYRQGYLRLSSQDYIFSKQNRQKAHLTNFSVNYINQKDKLQNSYLLFSDLQSYLSSAGLSQGQILYQNIKQKVKYVLKSASINWRKSQTDKHSFQLFGFDVILDSNLQPFVLECNMSPACHQRGQLKHLQQQMATTMLINLGLINQNRYAMKNKWDPIVVNNKLKKNQLIPPLQKCMTNYQFQVIGNQITSKNLLKLDYFLTCHQKIILIQRFYKKYKQNHLYNQKYKPLKQKHQVCVSQKNQKLQFIQSQLFGGYTKICKLIQILSKISKNKKVKWCKKMIRYVKRRDFKFKSLSS